MLELDDGHAGGDGVDAWEVEAIGGPFDGALEVVAVVRLLGMFVVLHDIISIRLAPIDRTEVHIARRPIEPLWDTAKLRQDESAFPEGTIDACL